MLAQLNDCIGGLLHLGPNVITFRALLHLRPNVVTFRTSTPVPPPFLFRVKKKEPQKEDKPAGQATKKRPPPSPPLTQGLDPPLSVYSNGCL